MWLSWRSQLGSQPRTAVAVVIRVESGRAFRVFAADQGRNINMRIADLAVDRRVPATSSAAPCRLTMIKGRAVALRNL